MSAKWRALQHRHRYTYNAVAFPPHFIQALNQTPYESPFFVELKHLISLNSTYAQLEHVKKLAAAFSNLLSDPNSEEKTISYAVKLYLEILFLENSLPLHKTLASALAKCKNFRSLIEDCFRELCEEYGGEESSRNGNRRFCVARAALSMMSTPKLGYLVEVVEQCAVLVGLDVVLGLRSIVNEQNEWSRPSPIVMEQCQEALSCMYYLLQRFPEKFCKMGGKQRELGLDIVNGLSLKNMDVLEMAFMIILSILKSCGFSRDCIVAADVSLCAAMQVCWAPNEFGLFIMQGMFGQTDILDCNIKLDDVMGKIPYKGDLIEEIRNFSSLSRLCLIRGILTAVSRTVLNNRFVLPSDGGNGYSAKTILYDAILPELCNNAENPIDSHSNFHALTVIQICLQQVKTLLQCDVGSMEDNYDPIPEDMGTRLLKIVWNNLEDPLSQTVKQVHLIFDLYLDIHSSLRWADGSEKIKLFLRNIASDLLHLGPRCKGRYIPLASLTRRLGAKTILDMNPDLIFESTKAYIDDDVCCAVTTFLKCFLECLRDEYWSSDGVDSGYTKYRSHCSQPFLLGLASGLAKLRSNLNTYALPVLLELDVDSIFYMLTLIGIGLGNEGSLFVATEINFPAGTSQKISVLVSLLKVSRTLALLEGDIDWYDISSGFSEGAVLDVENSDRYSVVVIKGIEVKVPVNWLILALTNVDESLRMDAAETLFLNPKTASLPSSLELSLMRIAVPLNMRCCSSAFQMKWGSLFRKFFSRVRTALERQFKQGTWKPLFSGDANVILYTGAETNTKSSAENLFDFIKWLSCFLFFSCYPSAPYERKIMAMDLILIMLNVWPVVPTLPGNQDIGCSETNLYPYSKGFTSPDSTLLLVGSIVDSWDHLRENSFQILMYFPTPLPGISSPDLVQDAILWAKNLVCSPRVRESDAGALTMRLLFRKYVMELSWIVKPSCNSVSLCPESELPNGPHQNCISSSPVVIYVISLIDWLCFAVEDAQKSLSEACKNSFVHGILLTLRYTFEALDWDSDVLLRSLADMKHVLERLLDLVMRITSLALWVVSADALNLPDDMEEMVDDDTFLLEIPGEIGASDPKPDIGLKASNSEQEVRRSEQIVMVGCWLAMKEVSLLLGTLIRKVPLPTPDEMENRNGYVSDESGLVSDALLDLKQLETIGNHFLEVLLKVKHNGAIDKTRAGFTALCNRLLCSNHPRLCKLTESWMDKLMQRTVAKGQTVDDLLRRSAGIPAAFIAFFLSEPDGTPKKLLPRALRWLLDLVKKPLTDPPKTKSSNSDSFRKSNSSEINDNKEMSKVRDEGVVPTVHAFNVLRAAFNDANLATDTSGFSAEALIISIQSFSSAYWEVRNSACLTYTALVRRMIGFLNVQKRESARRALTGLEFFHRYPALHPFLCNELKVATEFLSDASPEKLGPNLKNAVHPSLCPMLILLSRLKPSPISTETGGALDPFIFMPFIRRCSVQSNYRIRVLASKSLTGLVSNEKLQAVLLNIVSELPCQKSHVVSFNTTHGMLLQLNSLVDTNCRNLVDSSKKDSILDELIQILGTRSWIGRPKLCRCPTLSGSFLKLLDNMLNISRTFESSKSTDAISNLLWELSSDCLDLEPSDGLSFFDPTIQELRKQAATSYFNCVFQTCKEVEDDILMQRNLPSPASSSSSVAEMNFIGFQERLVRSLSDESYEVRIATLKWVFLFLKSSSRNNSSDRFSCEAMKTCLTNINLQGSLMKLLVSEKHHKCVRYILKILYTWNLLELEDNNQQSMETCDNMDCHAIFHLWEKLVSLFKITRHAKTRQTLICCLGVCIRRISNLYMSFISSDDIESTETAKFIPTDPTKRLSDFQDSINHFVDLIAQNSDASESVIMRKAAAESMITSSLLANAEVISSLVDRNLFSDIIPEKVIREYARKMLDLWFTCIKLLEDEDFELRKKIALDVQKYLTSTKPGKNFPAGIASNQVEKVIELCFRHLSTIFCHWLEYLDLICCWVFNAANNANYGASNGDLVRRVFDKEIDNHHEEKLLICQICCFNLVDIPISKSSKATDLLRKWRNIFFEQLIKFAGDRVGRKENIDWIGGVGNHKDAFLPVYANLLVFHALSDCIFAGGSENSFCKLSEVSAIGEAINPFLGNPFIFNLFLTVVKSHEKYLEGNLTEKWRVNDSTWAEFNPYFLLG